MPGLQCQLETDSLPDDTCLQNWGEETKEHYPLACAWLTREGVKKITVTNPGEVFDDQYLFRVQLGEPDFKNMAKHFDRTELQKQCLIPFFQKGYSRDLLVFERGPKWEPSQSTPP